MIKEIDFEIIKEDKNLVLYSLVKGKSKKEEAKKVIGYYTTMIGALKGALRFRRDKKYKGGQPSLPLQKLIKEYESAEKLLKETLSFYDKPIEILKEKVGSEHIIPIKVKKPRKKKGDEENNEE